MRELGADGRDMEEPDGARDPEDGARMLERALLGARASERGAADDSADRRGAEID